MKQFRIEHTILSSGPGFNLRDYQKRAVAEIRSSLAAGSRRVVMVMPTGSGKSATFAEITKLALAKGKRVLFLVHRRNLVDQTRQAFAYHGVTETGIIMSGYETALNEPVQLATYQTYGRRIKLEDGETAFNFPADLILVDEVHRGVSQGYVDIFSHYPEAVIVGCTATPTRADGRGLGEVFDSLVDVVDTQSLTDNGYLAPCRYFAPSVPNLDQIKIVRGDYDVKELDKRMNQAKLVGDVVQNWLRLAADRKTIVFAVSVAHSKALAAEFNRHGISAYHLSAKSTDEQRDYAFREMERGNIQVICNCALYQEGMDVPDISCVVMARPTKSLGLWRQCGGRGLRPAPGKDLMLLDHGGCIEENGLLTDPVEWSLDGKKKAWRKAKKRKPAEKKDLICSACSLIFSGSAKCPDCGNEAKSFGKKVEVIDADLSEIGGKKKATMEEKLKFYGMLRHYAKLKGYKDGWCYHKYKERFGVAPKNGISPPCIQPDHAFYSWMKHLTIKYLKSKERHAENRI